MRRFLSFRDFDWVLLGLVLLLSVISVLEIYSATMHTKFVGFESKQVLWLIGGMAAMFMFSLINYHRLLDFGALDLRLLPGLAGGGAGCWAPRCWGRGAGSSFPAAFTSSRRSGSSWS